MKHTNITKKLWFAALLVAILFTLLCFVSSAETVSGTCGAEGNNLTWAFNTETGELVISGTGDMENYSSLYPLIPWHSYDKSIKTVTIENGVTSIGDGAFSFHSNLTKVNIGNNVTRIGESAFYACLNLASVTIPNSVTSIDYQAFLFCEALTNLTLGNGVTSIGNYAFGYCKELMCVTIPNRVTSIGDGAFSRCTNLSSVIFNAPTGNVTIGITAFASCKGLTSITLPEGVTSIGEGAFQDCSNLVSVTISDSVTNIDAYAFSYCDSLTDIIIPKSVTSIGGAVFGGCPTLSSITVDANNRIYYSENNCIIEKESKALIAGCNKSVIPENVTSIGMGAFLLCTEFTDISLPNSVTSIGMTAFGECSNLISVSIPESVTSIGLAAFGGCSKLTSITINENNRTYYSENNCIIEKESKTLVVGCSNSVIPEDVLSIADYSFYASTNLTSITIPKNTTNIGEAAFDFCPNLTNITILSKTVSIYDNEYTLPTSATIYGYAGSTAEAYATKYGRAFVALNEEPIDGAVIAYQVSKAKNGTFSLRLINGFNSLDYKNYGFEIAITTKDANGNDVVRTVSTTSHTVYSSFYGGGTQYSVKENFNYNYAGLATVTGLAIDSSYTKIEIRSYVTTPDGKKAYANEKTLLYTGATDEEGYPVLSVVTK